jgi:bacteriophage N4 adsorption protein B
MVELLFVAWFLVSALDDFVVLIAWLWSLIDSEQVLVWPKPGELFAGPERRMAIFVPAWREERVIERMLEQNTATLRYTAYQIFVGTYPNDRATQEAVRRAAARDGRIRLVVGPTPGPTSKADCLNAVYRRMKEVEAEEGAFDLVLIHDAEDVLHSDELHWKNWFAAKYEMVQTAVLPIATPIWDFTHGLYCDDFAEFHTKDMRARNWLGGFIPSCGVATAFGRDRLEGLARESQQGDPFTPGSLTEDYELGYRLHCQGARQVFVPLPSGNGPVLATREYFPRNLRAAVRQRSRWLTGIVFQGWQSHGWGRNAGEAYWFWRDRKGVLGSPLSLVASLMIGLHLAFGWPILATASPVTRRLAFTATVLSLATLAARSWCSGRIYGFWFGLLAPVRQIWGNWLNTLAVAAAAASVVGSLRSGRGLAWRKTEHSYPWVGASAPARSLGEILVSKGAMSVGQLRHAIETRPLGMSLAEHIWRKGQVSAEEIQLARNTQYGLDGVLGAGWQAARVIPAEMAEKWRVVPIGIGPGEVRLASVEMPPAELERELSRQTRLRPRLILVTPARYGQLKTQFYNQLQIISKK